MKSTILILGLLAALAPGQDLHLSSNDARAASVPPAGSASLTFIADPSEGGEDLFDIVSSDAAVVASLLTPAGAEVTRDSAAGLGYSYEVFDASRFSGGLLPGLIAMPGVHTLIRLPAGAPAGSYTVRLDGSKLSAPCSVVAVYTSSSRVRAGLSTGRSSYLAGQAVALSAYVYNGAEPVLDAKAEMWITDPANLASRPESVPVTETAAWREAGAAGVYGAIYRPAREGRFLAVVRFTGTAAGKPFSRSASQEFRVSPALASFTSFEDTAVDDDADGILDRVLVRARLKVAAAGDYRFGISLATASGAAITSAETFSLTEGDKVVELPFEARQLALLDADGPYSRLNAVLTAPSLPGSSLLDERADAGPSAAYALSSFTGQRLPTITVDPPTADFGDVTAGTTRELSLTVRNASSFPVTESTLPLQGAEFWVTGPPLPLVIPAGGSLQITLAAKPPKGHKTGSLRVCGINVPLSVLGMNPAPALALSPARLAFGAVAPNSTRDLPLAIENRGDADLNIPLARTDNNRFSVVTAVPLIVKPGAAADLVVRFSPLAAGPQEGSLTLFSNTVATTAVIPLDGSGSGTPPADAPVIEAAPASLDFGSVDTGTSKSLDLVVTNSGKSALSVQNAAFDNSRFTLASPSLPATIAAGARQTLSIKFSPAAAGPHQGTLILGSNAPARPRVAVALTGVGSEAGRTTPAMHVSSIALDFGSLESGQSRDLTLTVANSGKAALAVEALAASPSAFSPVAPVTAFSVAAGASQAVRVRFAPSSAGTFSGTLLIRGNDPDNPRVSVSLSGKATAAVSTLPAIAASPAALDFGAVDTGQAKDLTVEVSNTGKAALNVTGLSTDNPRFTATPAAPFSVAAGAKATVTVRFSPTAAGAQAGNLVVASNDPAKPQFAIPLAGTGRAPAQGDSPAIAVTPVSLDFGAVDAGQSKDLTLDVSNTGKAALNVTGLSTDNPRFTATPAAPFNVAAGAKATVTVRFSPTAAGAHSANLLIASNDPAKPQVAIPLAGTGRASGQPDTPSIAVSPANLDFGNVSSGQTKSLTFEVANTGKAALNVTSLVSSNAVYSITAPGSSFTVAAGGRQEVTVRFAPSAGGSQAGTLEVRSNDPARPAVQVALTGAGTASGGGGGARIEVTPTPADFGTILTGTSKEIIATISAATGTEALVVSAITSDNPRFTIVSPTPPFTVAFGGGSPLRLRFQPSAPGPQTGVITIVSNAGNQPTFTLPVKGAGIDAGDFTVAVDDGTAEKAIGFSTPTNALFLQRLTPPAYPATLKAIRIYFPGGATGLPPSTIVGLYSGIRTGAGTGLEGLSLQTSIGMVPSPGQWVEFTLQQQPTLTIENPGDFIVGFSADSSADVKPVALDTSSPAAGRAYVATGSGVTPVPLATALKENGNFLIRAVVKLGP